MLEKLKNAAKDIVDKSNEFVSTIGNSAKNFFAGLFHHGEVKGITNVRKNSVDIPKPKSKTNKETEEINIMEDLSTKDLIKCISEEKIPENIIDLVNEVVDERDGAATLDVNKDISLILIKNENDGIDIYDSNSLEKPFAELSKNGELNIKDYNIANQLSGELGLGLLNDLKHVEVSNVPDLNAILNVSGQER